MAKNKRYRADNTYMLDNSSTDNPKLGAKILSNGKESLFLDFYLGFQMAISGKSGKIYKKVNIKREYLKLYLWQNPRTPIERQQNKDIIEVAKKIKVEQQKELLEQEKGYKLREKKNINFLDFFQKYIDSYNKKDKRGIKSTLKRFRNFLQETEEYNKFKDDIKPTQINKEMVEDFVEYLKSRSRGEGAHTTFAKFKKVINFAIDKGVIMKNPCRGIKIKVDNQQLKKDILSLEEVKKIAAIHYENEKKNVKRAFLFCLYCGLRYCDVKELRYKNIDEANKLLKFEQSKTKGHSTNSGVIIPLNENIMKLVGEPKYNKDELIFNLPGYATCLKELKKWMNKAEINKKITWHCARHSFAVNILNGGANIKTVASLLGHSGLKNVEKYTRAVDRLKEAAINSLPNIDF